MSLTYNIKKIGVNEYTFDTRFGISYSLEFKKSNAFYELLDGKICFLEIFSFSIFDKFEAINNDYITRNTIQNFILKYILKNDAILFFISNQLEDIHLTQRAKSRSKLFRRLCRNANRIYNLNLVFFTNYHFVLNPQEYKRDYIGIVVNTSSINYINIMRAFNQFCHENSYN